MSNITINIFNNDPAVIKSVLETLNPRNESAPVIVQGEQPLPHNETDVTYSASDTDEKFIPTPFSSSKNDIFVNEYNPHYEEGYNLLITNFISFKIPTVNLLEYHRSGRIGIGAKTFNRCVRLSKLLIEIKDGRCVVIDVIHRSSALFHCDEKDSNIMHLKYKGMYNCEGLDMDSIIEIKMQLNLVTGYLTIDSADTNKANNIDPSLSFPKLIGFKLDATVSLS